MSLQDDLERQIQGYKKAKEIEGFTNSFLEKKYKRLKSENDVQDKSQDKPQKETIIVPEREVIYRNNSSTLPSINIPNPFTFLLNLILFPFQLLGGILNFIKCLGCLVLILACTLPFLVTKVPQARDFMIENLLPIVSGSDDSKPPVEKVALPDRVIDEITRIKNSTSTLESMSIFEEEANALFSKNKEFMDKYPGRTLIFDFQLNNAIIYSRNKDSNPQVPWIIMNVGVDNTSKPYVTGLTFGKIKLDFSKERQSLSNIPLVGSLFNIEKFDQEVNRILFGENSNWKVDRVSLQEGRIDFTFKKL